MIRGDKGFTLAEVLVATAFIAITAGAIGVGFMQGTGSVETGRQQTTAVYLGERRQQQGHPGLGLLPPGQSGRWQRGERKARGRIHDGDEPVMKTPERNLVRRR